MAATCGLHSLKEANIDTEKPPTTMAFQGKQSRIIMVGFYIYGFKLLQRESLPCLFGRGERTAGEWLLWCGVSGKGQEDESAGTVAIGA